MVTSLIMQNLRRKEGSFWFTDIKSFSLQCSWFSTLKPSMVRTSINADLTPDDISKWFQSRNKILRFLPELWCAPMVLVVWCKVAIKLKMHCLKAVLFTSWCYDKIKHVLYCHRSLVLSYANCDVQWCEPCQQRIGVSSPARNRKLCVKSTMVKPDFCCFIGGPQSYASGLYCWEHVNLCVGMSTLRNL